MPLRSDIGDRVLSTLGRVCLLLFLIFLGLAVARLWYGAKPPGLEAREHAALLLTAALGTVLASASQLPLQNVLLGALVAAVIGGSAHALTAATGIPFGPLEWPEGAGILRKAMPWFLALLWVPLALNARNVARVVLQPWRHSRNYGLWVLGIGVLLVVTFALGLEPYAAVLKQYWTWGQTRVPAAWHGVPPTVFLGWLVTSLIALAFVTPCLLDKKPGQRPTDYTALGYWIPLNGLFLAAAVRQGWWWAGATIAVHLLAILATVLFVPRNRTG